MSAKGAKVQRRTFDKWAVSGVLGHKTVIESGLEYVYFVWCKVCAARGYFITDYEENLYNR